MIEELKQAAAEVKKQRELVEQEMDERGSEGKLWQNGLCKAWPAYMMAHEAQSNLREKYGV